MQNWNSKQHLSYPARIMLAQTFTMTRKLIDKLISSILGLIWNTRLHQVDWDSLCLLNAYGEQKLINIDCFCKTLLAKQEAKFYQYPDNIEAFHMRLK